MESYQFIEPLTAREHQVMHSLMRCLSATLTARQLGLSINTVKYHQRNIYDKLGASSIRSAVDLYCLREGILRYAGRP